MEMNFVISPTDLTENKIVFLSLSAFLHHRCQVVNNAVTFICLGELQQKRRVQISGDQN